MSKVKLELTIPQLRALKILVDDGHSRSRENYMLSDALLVAADEVKSIIDSEVKVINLSWLDSLPNSKST